MAGCSKTDCGWDLKSKAAVGQRRFGVIGTSALDSSSDERRSTTSTGRFDDVLECDNDDALDNERGCCCCCELLLCGG